MHACMLVCMYVCMHMQYVCLRDTDTKSSRLLDIITRTNQHPAPTYTYTAVMIYINTTQVYRAHFSYAYHSLRQTRALYISISVCHHIGKETKNLAWRPTLAKARYGTMHAYMHI
jgi:hypothetical protein